MLVRLPVHCCFIDPLLQVWLCWRYPIKTADGSYSIPTCPYHWLNGQGDVAKLKVWRMAMSGLRAMVAPIGFGRG